VIASGRLLRQGVLLKSATALERLAQVDTVVFDKTGTLTLGRPTLDDSSPVDEAALRAAASLAGASRHPLARALAAARPGVPVAEGVEEVPGFGLRQSTPQGEVRLGNRAFCGVANADGQSRPELWLARPRHAAVRFAFTDQPRADAAAVVQALEQRGLAVELLSGDRAPVAAKIARVLAIDSWRAGCTPADKTARLEQLAGAGRRVLMVGDGLNDAPALAAAHVSLSPSSAVDISQNAADAVFQGERLEPVVETLGVARKADRLIRQNLGLALTYNVLVVPLAVLGFVTPLIAALCMSASSLLVVGNALRLGRGGAA
jgi:Cu2+-exporting ATPase